MIKSRLLKEIERDIAAAASPLESVGAQARRSILLARHGRVPAARDALTALHQLAFQHPQLQMAAWLHLVEGLLSYFSDFGSDAWPSLQRALNMAEAGGNSEVRDLALAWMCHLAYVRHDADTCAALAARAQAEIAREHHSARSRLCMALGLAQHYAGQAEVAKSWWAQCRAHAQAEGDDATLSALIYNMAEQNLGQLRRETLIRATSLQAAQRPEALLVADSVTHFDAAVGGSALEVLTPLLRAQALLLQGEHGQALALFEEHLPTALSKGLERLGSRLLSELAWCRLQCGQLDAARQQAAAAEQELDPTHDVDDRAATFSRLTQVYAALGDAEAAQRHQRAAVAEWLAFGADQAHWAELLRAAGLDRL
ncbi:MAG TPA: hypothetical protein VGE47_15185 [Burkholderiaceae bacterium]